MAGGKAGGSEHELRAHTPLGAGGLHPTLATRKPLFWGPPASWPTNQRAHPVGLLVLLALLEACSCRGRGEARRQIGRARRRESHSGSSESAAATLSICCPSSNAQQHSRSLRAPPTAPPTAPRMPSSCAAAPPRSSSEAQASRHTQAAFMACSAGAGEGTGEALGWLRRVWEGWCTGQHAAGRAQRRASRGCRGPPSGMGLTRGRTLLCRRSFSYSSHRTIGLLQALHQLLHADRWPVTGRGAASRRRSQSGRHGGLKMRRWGRAGAPARDVEMATFVECRCGAWAAVASAAGGSPMQAAKQAGRRQQAWRRPAGSTSTVSCACIRKRRLCAALGSHLTDQRQESFKSANPFAPAAAEGLAARPQRVALRPCDG